MSFRILFTYCILINLFLLTYLDATYMYKILRSNFYVYFKYSYLTFFACK